MSNTLKVSNWWVNLWGIESSYKAEEMDKMDMHSLNLFGVPMEEGKETLDNNATNKETQ